MNEKATETYFQKMTFEKYKIRMERCKDNGGDYIEGDKLNVVKENI